MTGDTGEWWAWWIAAAPGGLLLFGLLLLWLAFRAADRVDARLEARLALERRAGQQHALVLAGDDRGMLGRSARGLADIVIVKLLSPIELVGAHFADGGGDNPHSLLSRVAAHHHVVERRDHCHA